MTKTIKAFAVDDDCEYLDSLEILFKQQYSEFQLIGTHCALYNEAGVHELIHRIQSERPHVILMDYSFKMMDRPDDFGLELTRRIIRQVPDAKIIMLVGDQDEPDGVWLNKLRQSFMAGAAAYLSKSDPIHWVEGILESLRDDACPPMTETDTRFTLTSREMEIIKLLSKDKAVKEVAQELSGASGQPLSVYTVNFHIRNICVKLRVRTLHGIMARAAKLGLLV
jgi:DNA-binding NarL/FixJ family response regulator